jgi:hypothetical protein
MRNWCLFIINRNLKYGNFQIRMLWTHRHKWEDFIEIVPYKLLLDMNCVQLSQGMVLCWISWVLEKLNYSFIWITNNCQNRQELEVTVPQRNWLSARCLFWSVNVFKQVCQAAHRVTSPSWYDKKFQRHDSFRNESWSHERGIQVIVL